MIHVTQLLYSSIVGTLLVVAGVVTAQEAIEPERLYVGADRPVMVSIAAPAPSPIGGGVDDVAEDTGEEPSADPLALLLLEPHGRAVGSAVAVRPGRIDLVEIFPEIRNLRRTMYVQALHHGEPRGSALVVQPLLEPMRPQTVPATRPGGQPYQRIVGWNVEDAEPEVGRDRRFFSGYRLYAERDVILHTTHGEIRIALAPHEAPNTAWNFLHLAHSGFYDGVIFHRIVPLDRDGYPFVIQGGDPSGTGRGGPGYAIDLEPSDIAHDFGVISMARTDDPNSAGSQFFICLSREGTGRLDGQYTAFGYAVSGAETIINIADVELADPAAGRPVKPPVIERAEIVPAPPRAPGFHRAESRVERPAPPAEEEETGRVPR